MGAFGERLRREREMRGISLNEISESTKISRRHLEALESERFEALPGGVFNRGFVRAYARFVGIDEEQAVADYNAVSQEQSPPPDQFPLEIHKPDRELNPRRSLIPVILGGAALLGFIVAVWVRSISSQPEASKNANPPVSAPAAGPGDASPSPPPAAAGPGDASPSPSPSAAGPGDASPSPPPAAAVSPAVPVATEAPATSTPGVSVAPVDKVRKESVVSPLASPAPTPDRRFVVIVHAKEDTWVSLSADGLTAWEGFLKANRKRLVRAGKRVVVTTNNAGGLTVSYNGRLMRVLGSKNEVRTMTFTRTGLVQ